MRRALFSLIATVTAATLAVGIAPLASATPDLGGSWNAASLRNGGPGYSMKVTAADADPGNAYFVVLRFHYQDGTLGKRIKAGMASKGKTAWLVLNGKGGLADLSNPNIMKGTIGNDGSLYFPTCYKQLPHVTKKLAPEMCLFQELPA